MKLVLILLALLSAIPARAEEALKDCLQAAGEVAPNAENLVSALYESIAKDKFLHRGYLSPLELRQIDAKKLAEMLVARLDEECEKPRTAASAAADADAVASEIVMMIPAGNLTAIAELGFQNQHATKTTGGSNASEKRFTKEQAMMAMQLPYGAKMISVLPKYSTMNIKDPAAGFFGMPTQYGNTALILKSEVKKRTTFTFQDSLGGGFERGKDQFPPRTTNYRMPKETGAPRCNGYCEAQIWGPVDLTDVDYLMVKKGDPVTEEMKALGLPIYEMETNNYIYTEKERIAPDQAAQFKRGQQLFAGGAVKRPKPLESRAELEGEIKMRDGVARTILKDRLLEKLSNQELIDRYRASPLPPKTYYSGLERVSERGRLFSELAARPLSPEIEKLLRDSLDGEEMFIRHKALLGLSDLPYSAFRPLLLKALEDPSVVVRNLATIISAEHATRDEDLRLAVAKSLSIVHREDANFKNYGVDAKENFFRLRRNKYCGEE